ncbi:MAG: thioredoxin-like domain-containing protein [Actinomycetota bacterium]
MKFSLSLSIIALFLLPFSYVSGAQTGHSITVTVNDGPGIRLRLAYHVGNQQYIRDSLVTDQGGKGRFFGSERLPEGVYLIVLPENKFFELLVGEDQYFDILFSKSDPEETLSFTGSDENSRFVAYQRKWKQLQDDAMKLAGRLNGLQQGGKEAVETRKALTEQENRMKQYLRETAESNRGLLLGAIARSMIPVEPPPAAVPPGTHNPDSVSRLLSYNYYKNHFFDNIDFTEPGLIRSPVLGGKLDQFFRQVVIQMPDSIIREADKLLEMSAANKDVFQYVAVWLMNKYAASEIMGHDGVVVHLADRVYLAGKAPWASEEYISDLRKRIERLRPNLIGNKAPELLMGSFAGHYVSLYDSEAEFTIVYFWEPDCGHCKETTPKLKEYYDRNKSSGIEVFAVCTHHDREKWERYIVDNGLSWVNGWDPQRMSRFDFLYNVESTPLIYILDRNKKIIAKRLAIEDVPSFIDSYRKYQAH